MKEKIRILICTPFCNEEHSIPKYVKSLLGLDYSKDLIDLLWVENNSEDNTWKLLQKYASKVKNAGYASFRLIQKSSDMGIMPKEPVGIYTSGKIHLSYGYLKRSANHLLNLYNFFLDEIRKEHDFIMYYFADVVTPSNTIKRFLSVMKTYKDCGWVGGIIHRRMPRHFRFPTQDPLTFGLEGPTIKVYSNSKLPSGFRKEWIHKYKEYPYGIRGSTEEEILERQKNNDGIFNDVCCTGHVLLIRGTLVRQGIRFKKAIVESAVQFERDMDVLGYKIYCDSYIYLKHISVDGKIYRHDLVPMTVPRMNNEAMKIHKYVREYWDTHHILRKKFVEFLRTNNIGVTHSIPRRPNNGETTFDGIQKKIINSKQWDDFYGRFTSFINDKKRLLSCLREAQN